MESLLSPDLLEALGGEGEENNILVSSKQKNTKRKVQISDEKIAEIEATSKRAKKKIAQLNVCLHYLINKLSNF